MHRGRGNIRKYEYVLSQEMIDSYREGVMDPEASFPTISHKVDVMQYNQKYRDNGSLMLGAPFTAITLPLLGRN